MALERRSLFPEAPLSDSGDQSPDSIFSALCDERRHSFGSSSSVSIPPPAPHTKVRLSNTDFSLARATLAHPSSLSLAGGALLARPRHHDRQRVAQGRASAGTAAQRGAAEDPLLLVAGRLGVLERGRRRRGGGRQRGVRGVGRLLAPAAGRRRAVPAAAPPLPDPALGGAGADQFWVRVECCAGVDVPRRRVAQFSDPQVIRMVPTDEV